jgi:DNA-binding transcriptional MocR family regulator
MSLMIDDPAAMTAMQQYNLEMAGHAKLRAWLRSLVYHIQKPARDDLDVILTAGCNITLDCLFRMLLDDGDSILVEESMFPAVRARHRPGHT